MSDENIIKLLFERSEEALTLIQESYGRLIRSISFNIFKSDSISEECLNDTLLAIWDSIPPEKPDSLSAYACTIARRKSIDRFRREQAQKRFIPDNSLFSEVFSELSSGDNVEVELIERLELKRIMNDFLRSLSPTNREIFMSRYFDFDSLDSISHRLHISKNSLNVKLFRMREKLRELLRKEGMVQ